NLNFIASTQDNYWYLYLRFSERDPKPWCAPALIHGYDLAKIAKALEELDILKSGRSYQDIYLKAKGKLSLNTQKINQELDYPEANSPYYEGMNRIVGGKYWLGLYWRNNKLNINFLKALCQL